MNFLRLPLITCMLSCSTAAKEPTIFAGIVIGIKDGDTIDMLLDGKPVTVRLFGIDCPEKSQPFGKAAKQATALLCFGKTMRVEAVGRRDRYKRIVGIAFVDGLNINEQLIRKGLAWQYSQYSNNQRWATLEDSARRQRTGLWSQPHPVQPWEWRKAKRKHRSPELAY